MKRKHIVLLSILVVIIGLVIAIIIIKSNIETNLEQLADTPVSSIDLSRISDGVYTGSYKAFPITAEVKVTVQNHIIKKIDLVKHENGQGTPAEIIPDKVVKSQSLDVDTVSGATYSSKVILKAIENALINANKK